LELQASNDDKPSNSERLEKLLTQCRELSKKDPNGNSPLHIASKLGAKIIVTHLVEVEKVDVNLKNKLGQPPLILAAQAGHEDVVRELLRLGAEPQVKDIHGKTPMHYAAHKGNQQVIELLAEAGGPLELKDEQGRTPLYTAAYHGIYEICLVLLRRNPTLVNVSEMHGWTPLHAAADQGHLAICELFVNDHNAKIDVLSHQGTTPLYHAAAKGKRKVVEFLVKAKANVNAGRKDSWLPIHASCSRSFNTITRFLIEAGADVNAICKEIKGYAPLHILLCQKDASIKLIEYLLDSGANVNAKTETGATGLHLAVHWSNPNIVELLCKRGVDVNAKNKKGKTALDLAVRYGLPKIAEILARKMKVKCPAVSKKQEQKFTEVAHPLPAPHPDDLAKDTNKGQDKHHKKEH